MSEAKPAGGEPEPVTLEELQLAVRNHSMPLEALRYAVTPVGLHYVLTHFDIPEVERDEWRLEVGGGVRNRLVLSLDDLLRRPAMTLRVTLECAGNGRALLSPRPINQPWLLEAVGTAEWTGTPLGAILEEAGPLAGAVEVLFGGLDRGIQDEVDHYYERSLPLQEAFRHEVILAYSMNGQALPPQHGFPLRLIVPGWYGMAHVKWLSRIIVLTEPFKGVQQGFYRFQKSDEDPGIPLTRMRVRALMMPPGVPDFLTRTRHLPAGRHILEGRAWSGNGTIQSVEVSTNGGKTWQPARLGSIDSPFAWRPWRYEWAAERGTHDLSCRATDSTGDTQPIGQNWNFRGVANNMVQQVRVIVA